MNGSVTGVPAPTIPSQGACALVSPAHPAHPFAPNSNKIAIMMIMITTQDP
jgi:hypothetical protein